MHAIPAAWCLVLVAPVLRAGDTACTDWNPGFGPPGAATAVLATARFDDGSGGGSQLYVAGWISAVGEIQASGIARWDGARWLPVGGGLPHNVTSLAVYDDGGGAKLYAGMSWFGYTPGQATIEQIARWDGVQWEYLPGGVGSGPVHALAVYDDGTGPGLYAAGNFAAAQGSDLNARGIVRFDAGGWHDVGGGLAVSSFGTTFCNALLVHDDGSGPALFAAGRFFQAAGGSLQVRNVARWNGSAWSALGGGVGIAGGSSSEGVHALARWNDGGGQRLVAAGYFTDADGAPAGGLATWNGASWSPLGSGIAEGSYVYAASALGAPSAAQDLYVAGSFAQVGGVAAANIARYDGASWSEVSGGATGPVTHLRAESAPATALVVGGQFTLRGTLGLQALALWDGAQWSGIGPSQGASSSVLVLRGWQGDLVAGGNFLYAGAVPARRIARWDGTAWSALGDGLDAPPGGAQYSPHVEALAEYGGDLYAAGQFERSGATPLSHVARWDGGAWSALGEVLPPWAGYRPAVRALETFDDGQGGGPRLYAGGFFASVGGTSAAHVARWNGSTWEPVGAGFDGEVFDFAVYDDGAGPRLVAAGEFFHSGATSIRRVARWTGTAWEALGVGAGNGPVYALCVHDDGTGKGRELYAGGRFTNFTSFVAYGIGKWNGSQWVSLGDGALGYDPSWVEALCSYDDGQGQGPRLYAGGRFASMSGVTAYSIARWNGAAWESFGSNGTSGHVFALHAFDDGSPAGAQLYAGGSFSFFGDTAAQHVARYGPRPGPACATSTGDPFCFGDGTGTACPCSSGLAGHGCENSRSTGGATLRAEGQAHVAADRVTLVAESLPPSATTLFLQGTQSAAGGAGTPFGDGLLCLAGSVTRLRLRQASSGVARLGQAIPGDPEISDLGNVTQGGVTRRYQAWYRDVDPGFCTPSTFNLTSALLVRWAE